MSFFKRNGSKGGRLSRLLELLKDPVTRKRIIIGASVASLIVVLGLLISGVPLSTNPTFCGKMCHATNPEYQSWSKSAHGEIACHFCHMDRSYVGLYAERFIKPIERLVLVETNSFDKPLNAGNTYGQNLDKTRCMRCHSPKTRQFTGKRGLNVTSEMHVKHLDAGLQCTTCHNRIAHVGAEKYEPLRTWKPGFKYKNFMTMRQGCWRCHSNDPKYRDAKALALVGDKIPPVTCSVCHNPKWNLKPETGRYNHNEVKGIPWRDGKRRHGLVAKTDFSACLGCHEKNTREKADNTLPNCATTCHKGITMPHNVPKWAAAYKGDTITPLWLRQHPWEADRIGVVQTSGFSARDPQNVCSMCHNNDKSKANFCQSCHHQEFDRVNGTPTAPWKLQHPAVVKEIGSSGCQRCHLLEFCAYCHTNGRKPERGTFFNRQQQAVPTETQESGAVGD